MSYAITAYRANMARVSTRFGITVSKKKSAVRRACEPRAAAIDEALGNEPPLFLSLVEELLAGTANWPGEGARYWYAYEGFVQALGQRLPNDAFYTCDTEPFVAHPAFGLYDIEAPFELPHPDDFPMVFTMRSEAMTEANVAEFVELLDEAQRTQFQYWIKETRRYKQDLVLFYY